VAGPPLNQKRVRNRIHNGSRSGAKSVPQPAPKLTQKRCEKRPETCTRNSPRRGNKWHQNAAENESKTGARIAPNPGPKMVPKLIPKRRQTLLSHRRGAEFLKSRRGRPMAVQKEYDRTRNNARHPKATKQQKKHLERHSRHRAARTVAPSHKRDFS